MTDFAFYCTTHPDTVAEYVPQRLRSATRAELDNVACFDYPEWAAGVDWGWGWGWGWGWDWGWRG